MNEVLEGGRQFSKGGNTEITLFTQLLILEFVKDLTDVTLYFISSN